jgi:hypothetical protein
MCGSEGGDNRVDAMTSVCVCDGRSDGTMHVIWHCLLWLLMHERLKTRNDNSATP